MCRGESGVLLFYWKLHPHAYDYIRFRLLLDRVEQHANCISESRNVTIVGRTGRIIKMFYARQTHPLFLWHALFQYCFFLSLPFFFPFSLLASTVFFVISYNNGIYHEYSYMTSTLCMQYKKSSAYLERYHSINYFIPDAIQSFFQLFIYNSSLDLRTVNNYYYCLPLWSLTLFP